MVAVMMGWFQVVERKRGVTKFLDTTQCRAVFNFFLFGKCQLEFLKVYSKT